MNGLRGHVTVFALLLAALVSILLIALMILQLSPTTIRFDLTVRRVVLQLPGEVEQRLLGDLELETLVAENLLSAEFERTELQTMDSFPAQAAPEAGSFVLAADEDPSLGSRIVFRSESEPLGLIDQIWIDGGEVILESRDSTLQVAIRGPSAKADLGLNAQEVEIQAQYVSIDGGPTLDWLRALAHPENAVVRVLGQDERLVLALQPTDREVERIEAGDVLRIEGMELVSLRDGDEPVSSLHAGSIEYLGLPRKPAVSLRSGDGLRLEELSDFRIEKLAIERESGLIALSGTGEVGTLRGGPVGYASRLHLNAFERIFYSEGRIVILGICTALSAFVSALFTFLMWARER